MADKVRILAEENVDHQVEKALDLYLDRVRGGRLVVIGAILDITNQYGKGKNRLLVININGEKREKALRRLPLTNKLSSKLKKLLGRKPATSHRK